MTPTAAVVYGLSECPTLSVLSLNVLVQFGEVGTPHIGAVPHDGLPQAGAHRQMPDQERFQEGAGKGREA